MSAGDPRINTSKPEHRGERKFADALEVLCDKTFDLWFSVDYLPGVSDLDLLICQEGSGFFAVEVKAIPLHAITEYSASRMVIAGRETDRHPLKQARRAQIKLVEYLKAVRVAPPFIYTSAAFPMIKRSEFLERFGGSPLIEMQASGMLFAEDVADVESLKSRLADIVENPPFGAKPAVTRRPSADVVRAVVAAIDPVGKPTASPADVARSGVLQEPIRKGSRRDRLERFVQPGRRLPIVFRGYPGTGKTFYLLRIALEHARAGRSVLFACFNKVLAGDIRRLLATTNLPKEVTSRIDVTHVWALRSRYTTEYVDGDDGVLDELPTLRTAHSPLEVYGTVCVDEAQDLPEWAFQLIEWHASESAEWFLAHGPGQELYKFTPAPYMVELLDSARQEKRIEQLNRVYRTAHVDFLVAQGVYEHAPDAGRIEAWIEKHPLPDSTPQPDADAQGALFDDPLDASFEDAGRLPAVVEVPKWESGLAPTDMHLRRRALRQVLTSELSAAAAEGHPGDVAVLLRHVSRKDDANDVRAVLDELRVPYVDQIHPSNRDLLLPAGHVRLVSFKSARGIEAHRTVLIGFDDLDGVELTGMFSGMRNEPLRESRNQAYIALSRSKLGTTIITRPHRRRGFSSFLCELVEAYAAQRVTPTRSADSSADPSVLTTSTLWREGRVDRVVDDGHFGFVRTDSGEEAFFHSSGLLGLEFENVTGASVVFCSTQTERGLHATIVGSRLPEGHALKPQPGYQPGYVCSLIGDRGFGFLLVPTMTRRVLVHVNKIAGAADGLQIGDRVDVLIDDPQDPKPRAVLVVPRL